MGGGGRWEVGGGGQRGDEDKEGMARGESGIILYHKVQWYKNHIIS